MSEPANEATAQERPPLSFMEIVALPENYDVIKVFVIFALCLIALPFTVLAITHFSLLHFEFSRVVILTTSAITSVATTFIISMTYAVVAYHQDKAMFAKAKQQDIPEKKLPQASSSPSSETATTKRESEGAWSSSVAPFVFQDLRQRQIPHQKPLNTVQPSPYKMERTGSSPHQMPLEEETACNPTSKENISSTLTSEVSISPLLSSPACLEKQSGFAEVEVEHSEKSVQHSEKSMQHSEKSVQHSEKSVQHSEKSMQHSEKSVQHSEKSMQHSEKSVQHSEKSMQHSEKSVRLTENENCGIKTCNSQEKISPHDSTTKSHCTQSSPLDDSLPSLQFSHVQPMQGALSASESADSWEFV